VQIQTPTKDNLHVTMMRLVDSDSTKFSIVEVFRWLFITFDTGLTHEYIADGEIAVTDCKGFNIWHLLKALGSMSVLRGALKYSQVSQVERC
jgi:hypothetical protein